MDININDWNKVVRCAIDGEFEGFDGDNLYKLTNGTVWKRIVYKYHYAYMPNVTIYEKDGAYVMVIDGVNDYVQVTMG
jgi:hypothetical protein